MAFSIHGKQLKDQSLAACRSLFKSLAAPQNANINGRFQAEFVGPSWLRRAAGPALAVGGLGGWWGKDFDGKGGGLNLVEQDGALQTRIPVRLQIAISRIDHRPCVAIIYLHGSPFPWPLIEDELRWLDEQTLLGLTMFTKAGLHRISFPFLLHRQNS